MNPETLKKRLSNIRYIDRRTSDNEVNLKTFFEAIVHNSPLEVNRGHMESILTNDLNVKTEELNTKLVSVLCEALVYYMSVWPGWQRNSECRGLELQRKEWLERLRQYLIFKSQFIVKNSAKFEGKKAVCDQGTQTDGEKVLAPYSLVIGGPPTFINNIACNGHNGGLIIVKHPEKAWQPLRLCQFLNWPNVDVQVTLPDISLTRSNVHQVHRFIALKGVKPPYPDTPHIAHITKLSKEKEFQPYSYLYFFHYFHQLNVVLRRLKPNVKEHRLRELSAIFAEFLKDIREVGVYDVTMSPDASVGFNIGKCQYTRTKRLHTIPDTNSNESTSYNEIIVPQVDIALHYFNAVQDCRIYSKTVTFKSLNSLSTTISQRPNKEWDHFVKVVNNSCIIYKCLQCKLRFIGPDAYRSAVGHFRERHKSEQTVTCQKCRAQFEIEVLSKDRWSHKCVSS
uniref:Uncharacterized protein n=2 Tax=Photinus pyralis TaxID=7054 RepID=A0A1Y1KEU8_PHOPY